MGEEIKRRDDEGHAMTTEEVDESLLREYSSVSTSGSTARLDKRTLKAGRKKLPIVQRAGKYFL